MTLILLLAPALYAFGDYRSASRGSLMAMGLNVLLNGAMVFLLGFGAYSIAIATSFAAWFQCYYLLKRLKMHVSFTLPSPLQTILFTLVGVATYHFVSKYLPIIPSPSYLHQLATFSCLSLAFGLFPAYHLLRTKN
jgi:peptidoglycan biosynthesis protein MviN/MurJ (putative lipid II flippase)